MSLGAVVSSQGGGIPTIIGSSGLRVIMPEPPAAGISAAAQAALDDWVSRVQGQSSNVTIAGTQTAVGIFIDGLMTDGVWSKIVRMSIYAGDGLNALKAPLKNGGPGATDTLTNFVSGDYNQSVGLTGTVGGFSTSKAVKLGGLTWNNFNTSDTSIHVSLYIRSTPDGHTQMTSTYTGASYSGLQTGVGTNATAFYLDTQFGNTVSYTDANGIGHYIGTRTASNRADIYKNGSSVAFITTGIGTGRSLADIYVHCQSYTNITNDGTATPIEMYSYGTGLTATDALNFTNRYATLRSALGR